MFKVFTVKIAKYYPPTIAILTSFKSKAGDPCGEYFLIFGRPSRDLAWLPIEFDVESFVDANIDLTEQTIFDELRMQASTAIGLHVEHYYSTDKGRLLASGNGDLEDAGQNLLLHLHLRDELDFLEKISEETKDPDLRTYLKKVLKLPKITARR